MTSRGCGGSPAPAPTEPVKPYYAVLYFGVDTIRTDALDANGDVWTQFDLGSPPPPFQVAGHATPERQRKVDGAFSKLPPASDAGCSASRMELSYVTATSRTSWAVCKDSNGSYVEPYADAVSGLENP